MSGYLAAAMGGSALLNYYGQQQANEANSAQSANSIAFQQSTLGQNMQFSREMADLAYNRNVAMTDWSTNFAREMTDKANAFSNQQSSSAWQRGVADMKAAGINPMLSYQQGGASAGPGAMGSGAFQGAPSGFSAGSAPGAQARMENTLSGALSGAMDAARTIQGLRQSDAEIAKTEETTRLTAAETGRAIADTNLRGSQVNTEAERQQQLRTQQALDRASEGERNAASARHQADTDRTRQDIRYTDRYGTGGNDPRGVASLADGLVRHGANGLPGITGDIGNRITGALAPATGRAAQAGRDLLDEMHQAGGLGGLMRQRINSLIERFAR